MQRPATVAAGGRTCSSGALAGSRSRYATVSSTAASARGSAVCTIARHLVRVSRSASAIGSSSLIRTSAGAQTEKWSRHVAEVDSVALSLFCCRRHRRVSVSGKRGQEPAPMLGNEPWRLGQRTTVACLPPQWDSGCPLSWLVSVRAADVISSLSRMALLPSRARIRRGRPRRGEDVGAIVFCDSGRRLCRRCVVMISVGRGQRSGGASSSPALLGEQMPSLGCIGRLQKPGENSARTTRAHKPWRRAPGLSSGLRRAVAKIDDGQPSLTPPLGSAIELRRISCL